MITLEARHFAGPPPGRAYCEPRHDQKLFSRNPRRRLPTARRLQLLPRRYSRGARRRNAILDSSLRVQEEGKKEKSKVEEAIEAKS